MSLSSYYILVKLKQRKTKTLDVLSIETGGGVTIFKLDLECGPELALLTILRGAAGLGTPLEIFGTGNI